MSIGLDFKG